MRNKNFYILVFCFLLSETLLAQELQPGLYRGTRLCSDGALPKDGVKEYPTLLLLSPDGSFTSLVDVTVSASTDGVLSFCTERATGSYRLKKNILITNSEKFELCGKCENVTPSDAVREEKIEIEFTSKGFKFPQPSDKSSCNPDQHMMMNFERMQNPENPELICKPVGPL